MCGLKIGLQSGVVQMVDAKIVVEMWLGGIVVHGLTCLHDYSHSGVHNVNGLLLYTGVQTWRYPGHVLGVNLGRIYRR